MFVRARSTASAVVLLLASCGGEVASTTPPTTPGRAGATTNAPVSDGGAAGGIKPTAVELSARKPRWVLSNPQKPGAAFATLATSTVNMPPQVVALADGSRGFLLDGVRYRMRGEAVERIAGDEVPLLRVDVLPERVGGGVLFGAQDGIYRAKSFDAPIRKIAPLDPASFGYALGHGVVVVGAKAYDWNTGKLRSGKPAARVVVHSDGYSVSIDDGHARFSRDGVTSTDLKLDGVTFGAIAPNEKSILLQVKEEVFSVTANGKATRDPAVKSVFFASMQPPAGPFDAASLPAALAGSAWIDVPDSQGKKLATYHSGELVVVDRDSNDVARRDLRIKRDDCGLLPQGPDSLLVCGGFAEDRSMTVDAYRIDLGTGAIVLERHEQIEREAFAIEGGPFVGIADGVTDGAFVLTQRTCNGEASSKRMCMRHTGGKWLTVELPRNSRVFPFLAGSFAITQRTASADAGASSEELVVRDLEHDTDVVFGADVRAGLMRALGLDPRGSSREQMLSPMAPIPRAAMIPRAGVLRTLESTSALAGLLPAGKRLFVVDYVLGARSIEVRPIEGEFAVAERRLLRLHEGALNESGDGGETWTQVDSPITGVPKTLDGVRCTRNGCLLGPWVRVGWATR